ncbi:hypothetical protein FRC11_012140, partial [Ceratobasidium sp. 423]
IIELYVDSSISSSCNRLGSSSREGASSSFSPVNQAEDLTTALAKTTPFAHHPTPSSDGEYSPRHKRQLKALIADVLVRQQRGETLQIGDLRLEDYEDPDYSPPQEDESASGYEVSASRSQVNTRPIPPGQRFELPAWAPVVGVKEIRETNISTVDPTLVPLPAEDDEVSSILSTSPLDVPFDADHAAGNTTLGQVTQDEVLAGLYQEIGASLSLFDLSRRPDFTNSSGSSNILSTSSFVDSSKGVYAETKDELSRSTLQDIEPRVTIVTLPNVLDPSLSSILPSLFVSSLFKFDRTYNSLMTIYRRRLEIYYSLSVHLVSPPQPRRLMSHRMHSCVIYRTEAIGTLGQVLVESLKDAARVVGNCYPEARNNGAKFEVDVRIVPRATRHYRDSATKDWVSLGWESCECAFQLVVHLDNSISPFPANPSTGINSLIDQPSFWTRLWMYQLWDKQGDTFGPPQTSSSNRS